VKHAAVALTRRIGNAVARLLLRLGTRSGRVGSMYLSLFSSSFARESRGVLFGVHKHLAKTRDLEAEAYTLRRNVHRIEKGLLMRPRRDVFAVEYIGETVNCFGRVVEASAGKRADEIAQLSWAHGVLKQYFALSGKHESVEAARQRFEAIDYAPAAAANAQLAYRQWASEEPSVDYESFWQLAQRRKSVRWYQQRAVPRELIDKAISAAGFAPSACNRQPFEFLVFDTPESVQKVAAVPMGTKGYAENIPAIIVLVGKLSAFFSERDRHLIYIDGALAAMSFVLALETLGLSSCCINWPEIDEKERQLADLLQLEPDERPVMLIAVGYADPEGLVATSQRKPLDAIRKYPEL
jgi:nitroreductase